MEPRSLERGNHDHPRVIQCFDVSASMEPRSLERGNHATSGTTITGPVSFNGAAFSRTRKPTPSSVGWSVTATASMEPRSLERGNHTCAIASPVAKLASMEPRSLERGNPRPATDSLAGREWLQWSRVLSNAETAPLQSPQRQRCGIIFASGRWPYTQYRQYDQSNPSQVVQPQSASAVREMMSTSPLADRSTIKESPQIESATRLGYHRSTRHNRQNRNGCTGSRER